jgi:hypothetical protein
LTTLDPETRQLVRLFHPRQDDWEAHFAFRRAELLGLTEMGLATVRLLQINSPDRLSMRAELLELGEM